MDIQDAIYILDDLAIGDVVNEEVCDALDKVLDDYDSLSRKYYKLVNKE